MKNLITFCVLFLTVALLFTSCGSSLSITKRHYNKGYYISHNHVKSSNKTVSTDKVEEINFDEESVNEENQHFDKLNATHLAIGTQKELKMNYSEEFSDAIVDNSEEGSTIETSQSNIENQNLKAEKVTFPTIKSSTSKIKNAFSDTKNKYAHPRSDSHGLLWTIIVVLILLWLLGLLLGISILGELIHLLLVIAIILLILMLLGVI